MAKTLRTIHCPQCGSPAKTTLGPDLFRCNACQTEYYLDSDEVTVHVRYHYPAPPTAPRPAPAPTAARYWVASLFLLVALGALTWLYLLAFRPPRQAAQLLVARPIFYLTEYVYADAAQQPVYVTLRTEAPRWGSDSVTLYVDFFDPRTGQRRREQVLEPLGHRLDNHFYQWHTFPGGQVYLLGNQKVYRVDTRANQLLETTETLLAHYPPASSGVAQVEFDTSHEALRVLTNDGQTLYYLPATGQVLRDGLALYHAAYAGLPRRFFTFETLADTPWPQLLANRPTGRYPELASQQATPGRHYFDPSIVYQDATSLLVAVAPTARPDSPHSLQRLDVATGRVLWARPASAYDYKSAVRTRDGFALHYRTGSAQDYVHGALLLTADGQLLNDFQRARME